MILLNILESLVKFYLNFTSSYGLSIILLSLTVSAFLIPIDLVLKAFEYKIKVKKSLMQLELNKLEDVKNNIEKHFYKKIIHKQFQYSPFYFLIPAVKIIFQVPFLIAAYILLTSYTSLNGVSFGFIYDLSKPFRLLLINSVSINPLPVLMTLISFFDIYLNRETINYRERIVIAVTSFFFLIFLYNSPSAIVLYWITSNIFSLIKSIFIRNEIKVGLGSVFLKYSESLYLIVKSNFFLFNLVVFNVVLILFGGEITLYKALYGGLFSISFLLVYMFANSNKRYYIILSIATLTFVFVCFDNVFIPFLVSYLRIRYLIVIVFLSLLIIKKSINLIRVSNFFIQINCAYFILVNLIPPVSETYPEFTASNENTNSVSKFINVEVQKKNNIIIVVLDGYPSSKILNDFGIRNNLDSIFTGYARKEFNSNYFSTPTSLANLFFDVNFDKDQIMREGHNEKLLFKDAYRSSILFPLDTMYYDEVFRSLINSNPSIGISFWKPVFSKSFIYNVIGSRDYNDNIKAYNNRILDLLKKDLMLNTKKKKFGVYHFLTFHHLNSIQERVNYANDIIKSTLRIIPNNSSVLFISDHGLREATMSSVDKKSAIFYEKKFKN